MKYQMPEISYYKQKIWGYYVDNIYKGMEDVYNFKKSLNKNDYFDKNFWKEALKQKHFMPLFAEFLYDQGENYEKLQEFLRNNFQKEIENKIQEEIDKDLENLSSNNPEIIETSLIYTRYYTFYDFFEDDIKEVMDNLGLSRFYNDDIFDNLAKKDLEELNIFLLASLVNCNFNGRFPSEDCKRTIGCILNLSDFYEEEKADEIFADKVLYKMIQDLDTFYYIIRDDEWCWDFSEWVNIGKIKEFFENDNNRYKAIQLSYKKLDKEIPWYLIKTCNDLENIWEEDKLKEIAENLGYENFEEMCEENLEK